MPDARAAPPFVSPSLRPFRLMDVVESQHTVSTQLYVPPSAPSSNYVCDTAVNNYSLHDAPSKNVHSNHSGWSLNNSCILRRAGVGESSSFCTESTRKKRRRACQLAAADLEAAVGLTVTAAEAMVISSLLEEEAAAGIIPPSAILEGAIQLRRARKSYGLDEYDVGEICQLPLAKKDATRHNSLHVVSDAEMQDALVDVGFVDPALKLSGLCAAECTEPEGYGLNWGPLKIGGEKLLSSTTPSELPCIAATPETVGYDSTMSGQAFDLVQKPSVLSLDVPTQPPPHNTLEAFAKTLNIGQEKEGGMFHAQIQELEAAIVKQGEAIETVREQHITQRNEPIPVQIEYDSGGVQPTAKSHSGLFILANASRQIADDVNNLLLSANCPIGFQGESPIANGNDENLDTESSWEVVPKVTDIVNATVRTSTCAEPQLLEVERVTSQHCTIIANPPPRVVYPPCGEQTEHGIATVFSKVTADAIKVAEVDLLLNLTSKGMAEANLTKENGEEHEHNFADCTLNGGEQLISERRKRRTPVGCFHSCSIDDQSPPLLWPRCKTRRLRACREIGTGSDDLDPGAHEAPRCPAESRQEVPEEDQSVMVGGSVATEEVHQVRRNAAFKTFSFTQEENLLLAQEKLHKFYPVKRTTKDKNLKKRRGTDVSEEPLHTAMKKRKAPGETARMEVAENEGPLFAGLEFFLTGYTQQEKDKLAKSIKDHGGVVLLDIPHPCNRQARNTRRKDTANKTLPIVLAPQQVRTSKYLYGCAVGSAIAMASWLSDSLAAKRLLPFTEYNHKLKAGAQRLSADSAVEEGENPGNNQQGGTLFHNFEFFLHGRPTHCSQLKTLIQHGGGKVVSHIKHMTTIKNGRANWTGIVLAEDLSKVPCSLRSSAADLKLHLVAEVWVVDSLLTRRRLPLPLAAASLAEELSKSESHTDHAANIQESPLQKKRESHVSVNVAEMQLHSCVQNVHSNAKMNAEPAKCKKPSSWTWVGMSSVKPLPVPPLSAGNLDQMVDSFSRVTQCSKRLFYSSFSTDGVQYSLGDIVEIQPLSTEERTPFVARLEGLWSEGLKKSQSKISVCGKREEKVVMLCRWFYHPFETGFSCTSSVNDVYLSNHFDNGVRISRIRRTVKVTLVVNGNIEQCNNWPTESHPSNSSISTSCIQVADYNCRYFYDHENESLHQLRVKCPYKSFS